MSGDHVDIIRERKETAVDRPQYLFGVAAGQVGSAYGACEEGVSRDEEGMVGDVKATAALGMAGGVDDGSGETDDGDGLAVFEVFIGG